MTDKLTRADIYKAVSEYTKEKEEKEAVQDNSAPLTTRGKNGEKFSAPIESFSPQMQEKLKGIASDAEIKEKAKTTFERKMAAENRYAGAIAILDEGEKKLDLPEVPKNKYGEKFSPDSKDAKEKIAKTSVEGYKQYLEDGKSDKVPVKKDEEVLGNFISGKTKRLLDSELGNVNAARKVTEGGEDLSWVQRKIDESGSSTWDEYLTKVTQKDAEEFEGVDMNTFGILGRSFVFDVRKAARKNGAIKDAQDAVKELQELSIEERYYVNKIAKEREAELRTIRPENYTYKPVSIPTENKKYSQYLNDVYAQAEAEALARVYSAEDLGVIEEHLAQNTNASDPFYKKIWRSLKKDAVTAGPLLGINTEKLATSVYNEETDVEKNKRLLSENYGILDSAYESEAKEIEENAKKQSDWEEKSVLPDKDGFDFVTDDDYSLIMHLYYPERVLKDVQTGQFDTYFTDDEINVIANATDEQKKQIAYMWRQEYSPDVYDNEVERAKVIGRYLKGIKQEALQRRAEERAKKVEDFTKDAPFIANVGKVTSGIADKAVGGVNIVKDAVSDSSRPFDVNSMRFDITRDAQTVTATTKEMIKNPGWEAVYDIGMSVADNMATAGVSTVVGTVTGNPALGVKLHQTLMAGGAYQNGVYDATVRGASKEEAMAFGYTSAAVEFLTEGIGIDNLLEGTKRAVQEGSKSVLKHIKTQTVAEGLEEVVSAIAEPIYDDMIMGENSRFNRRVDELITNGMEKTEAEKQAMLEQGGEILLSGIAGAISGGVSSSVYSGFDYAQNRRKNKDENAPMVKIENAPEDKGVTEAVENVESEQAIPPSAEADTKEAVPEVEESKGSAIKKGVNIVAEKLSEGSWTTEKENVYNNTVKSLEEMAARAENEARTEIENEAARVKQIRTGKIAENPDAFFTASVPNARIITAEEAIIRADAELRAIDRARPEGFKFESNELHDWKAKRKKTDKKLKDLKLAKALTDEGFHIKFFDVAEKSDGTAVGDGATIGDNIYLNINGVNPVKKTLGHEFIHVLKNTNAEAYREFEKVVKDKFRKEFAHEVEADYESRYENAGGVYENFTDEMKFEEYAADVAGDMLINPEYSQSLINAITESGERVDVKKSKIKAIAEAVRSVVVKLRSALQKMRGTYEYGEATRYINDLQAVHQALVKAYREIGNKKATSGEVEGMKQSANSVITNADVRAIQAIQGSGTGHKGKSVNQFTSQEIKDTEAFAKKYWAELKTKSPFFRAWFGDWREFDTTPVKVVLNKGSQRGVTKNNDTGWDIQVSGKVFSETKAHLQAKNYTAIPLLDYIEGIVQSAILLDSYTIPAEHTKSPNSVMMHSMYAVVDAGNGHELVKLYVEELNDVNSDGTISRAYQLQNITNQQLSAKGSRNNSLAQSTSTADIDTVADLFSVVKQKDADFQPNPASVVRNADGTPKVVYHGTSEKFTRFDITKSRSWEGVPDYDLPGFYFAESKEDGLGYGETGEYYIKITKPYEGDTYALAKEKGSFRQAYEHLTSEGYDGVIVDEFGEGYNEYIVLKDVNIKSATDNIGTFDRTNPDIRFSFAGANADTADMSALEKAESMEQGKATAEEILRETGWYRGIDGKWRFEISDEDAEFSRKGDLEFKKRHPDYARYRELLKVQNKYALGIEGGRELTEDEQAEYDKLRMIWEGTFRIPGKVSADAMTQDKLEAYFNHDKLYEAYPQLRNVKIQFKEDLGGAQGQFDTDNNVITVKDKMNDDFTKSVIVHEIQHWIQKKEGFARGSNIRYWENRLAGEHADKRWELQKRKQSALDKMTEDFRKKVLIQLSHLEDVARVKNDYSAWLDFKQELFDDPENSEAYEEYEDAEWELDELKKKDINLEAKESYYNTAGEIESREASRRMNMTEAERRENIPYRGGQNTVFTDDSMISFSEDNKKTAEEAVDSGAQNDIIDLQVLEKLRSLKGLRGIKYNGGKAIKIPNNDMATLRHKYTTEASYATRTEGLIDAVSCFGQKGKKHYFYVFYKGEDYRVAPIFRLDYEYIHRYIQDIKDINEELGYNGDEFVNEAKRINSGLARVRRIGQGGSVNDDVTADGRGIPGVVEIHTNEGRLHNGASSEKDVERRQLSSGVSDGDNERNSDRRGIKFSMPAPVSQAQYEDRAYKLERDIRIAIEEKIGNKLSAESAHAVQGLSDSIAKGDEAKAQVWREVLRDSILKNDMVYYGEENVSDDVLSNYFKSMRKNKSKVLVEKEDSQDLTARELSSVFGVGGWSRTNGIGVDVVYEELANMGAELNEADSVQDRLIAIKDAREAVRKKNRKPMLNRGNVTELIDVAERSAIGAVSEVERAREEMYASTRDVEGAVPYKREPIGQANVQSAVARLNEMHDAVQEERDDVTRVRLEDEYREEQLRFFNWIMPHFTRADERGVTGDYCFHTNAELDAERSEVAESEKAAFEADRYMEENKMSRDMVMAAHMLDEGETTVEEIGKRYRNVEDRDKIFALAEMYKKVTANPDKLKRRHRALFEDVIKHLFYYSAQMRNISHINVQKDTPERIIDKICRVNDIRDVTMGNHGVTGDKSDGYFIVTADNMKEVLVRGKDANEARLKKAAKRYKEIVKGLDIKAGSEDSALIQDYGEGRITEQDIPFDKRERIVKAAETLTDEVYKPLLEEANRRRFIEGKGEFVAPPLRLTESERRSFRYMLDNMDYVQKHIADIKAHIKTAGVSEAAKRLHLNEGIVQAVADYGDNAAKYVKWVKCDWIAEDRLPVLQQAWNLVQRGKKYNLRSGKVEMDYFPHFEKDDAIVELGNLFIDQLPTAINGLTESFRPNSKYNPYFNTRTGNKTDSDAIFGANAYINATLQYIYHTSDITKARLAENHLRTKYGKDGGDPYVLSNVALWLHEWGNQMAGKQHAVDRMTQNLIGRRASKFLRLGMGNIGRNQISWNFRTPLSNFSVWTRGLAVVAQEIASGGGSNGLSYAFGNWKEHIQKSDFLFSRFYDDVDLSTKDWRKPVTGNGTGQNARNAASNVINAVSNAGKKVSDAGFKLMGWSDKFTITAMHKMLTGVYIAQGMSEEDAIRKADYEMKSQAASRDFGDSPLIFSSQTLRPFTMFQVEALNQITYGKDVIAKIAKNPKTTRYIFASLLGVALEAILVSLFNDLMKKATGSPVMLDVVGITRESIEGLAYGKGIDEIVPGVMEEIPIVNNIMKAANGEMSEMIGIGAAVNVVNNIIAGFNPNDEVNWGEMLYNAGLMVNPFGGLAQARKTYQAIQLLGEGYSENSKGQVRYAVDGDARDVIMGLLFGKSAMSSVQEWWDSGYESLNKNNSDAFKQMLDLYDINPEEAYNMMMDFQKKCKEAKAADVQYGSYEWVTKELSKWNNGKWSVYDRYFISCLIDGREASIPERIESPEKVIAELYIKTGDTDYLMQNAPTDFSIKMADGKYVYELDEAQQDLYQSKYQEVLLAKINRWTAGKKYDAIWSEAQWKEIINTCKSETREEAARWCIENGYHGEHNVEELPVETNTFESLKNNEELTDEEKFKLYLAKEKKNHVVYDERYSAGWDVLVNTFMVEGDTSVLPSAKKKTFDENKKTYTLNDEQYAKFIEYYNEAFYDGLAGMKNYTYEQIISGMSKLKTAATKEAKSRIMEEYEGLILITDKK